MKINYTIKTGIAPLYAIVPSNIRTEDVTRFQIHLRKEGNCYIMFFLGRDSNDLELFTDSRETAGLQNTLQKMLFDKEFPVSSGGRIEIGKTSAVFIIVRDAIENLIYEGKYTTVWKDIVNGYSIINYSVELKFKEIPQFLADLKAVMNKV